MHEIRNFVVVLVLVCLAAWCFVAWLFLGAETPWVWGHRLASTLTLLGGIAFLVYALKFEDKLPDHLTRALGEGYFYEADGLSFMPVVRTNGDRGELSLYYQNRYENPVECIVHLRPPTQSFVIQPGMRDVHIAFKADGGDFGVIHQPIGVPEDVQGEVLDIEMAATSFYPRSHGSRLRRHAGMPCGSLRVDWNGAAFRCGVHESSGEIEMISPVTLHLSMPVGVSDQCPGGQTWKQERLAATIGE